MGCSDWEHCVPPGTAVDNSVPSGTADIEGCEGSECCIPPGIAVCDRVPPGTEDTEIQGLDILHTTWYCRLQRRSTWHCRY